MKKSSLAFWVMFAAWLVLLVIFLGVLTKPHPSVVIQEVPKPTVEWKEKLVPVIKWKEKLVPVPYPVYVEGVPDTVWLTNVGYAVFDTTQVVSTVVSTKKFEGLLKVTLGIRDSINTYLDDAANVFIDKTSRLCMTRYELLESLKPTPVEVELRIGASLFQEGVSPRISLGLLKGWQVLYLDGSLRDVGIGLGVRF